MTGEQKDDGNQCCKMLKEKLRKEMDQLKRQIRKKTVSEIKSEKSLEEMKRSFEERDKSLEERDKYLEEKEKIIKELQSKCDYLAKENNMLKNNTQGSSSQQAEVEESINEQLDNEHKVRMATINCCLLQ